MSSHTTIKQQHELAVIHATIKAHNNYYGCKLKLVSQPDPPDAILSDGSYITWLEHTDAFISEGWARALSNHYEDPNSTQPILLAKHLDFEINSATASYVNTKLAQVFCDRILDKAQKDSYKEIIIQYGPGLLVVGLESPWLSSHVLDAINVAWKQLGSPDVSSTFKHIYIGYRDESAINHAIEWKA